MELPYFSSWEMLGGGFPAPEKNFFSKPYLTRIIKSGLTQIHLKNAICRANGIRPHPRVVPVRKSYK